MDAPETPGRPEPATAPNPERAPGFPSHEECVWAMVSHLGSLIGWLGSQGAGLLNFVVPLAIWQARKAKSAFVADQALEALNFQITMGIAWLMALLLALSSCGLFAFLLWAVAILNAGMSIYAAVRAMAGERYRYPFCLHLVR